MKNKQIFLAIVASFSFFTAAFSQQSCLEISVEGAPTYTILRGKNGIFKDSKLGYYGGIGVQYNFKKMWSLKTGLGFESKGGSEIFQWLDFNGKIGGDVKYLVNLNYLTLPVLAKMTFGKKVTYFLEAGVYTAFRVNSTYSYAKIFAQDGNVLDGKTTEKFDIVKDFDWGISVGMGMNIPISAKWSIPIQLRSNLGLYNVSLVASSASFNNAIKNNSVNLITGLTYKIGQKTTKNTPSVKR